MSPNTKPSKSTKPFDSGLHVFEQWVHYCENSSSDGKHITQQWRKKKERKGECVTRRS